MLEYRCNREYGCKRERGKGISDLLFMNVVGFKDSTKLID